MACLRGVCKIDAVQTCDRNSEDKLQEAKYEARETSQEAAVVAAVANWVEDSHCDAVAVG